MPADTPTDGLNPDQLDAVVHRGGPLLVVAGAGSGKTRVLTPHRHLIHDGVHPSRILAITFTNKPRTRCASVAALVGAGRPHDVGQHPLGVCRARANARSAGLPSSQYRSGKCTAGIW